MSQKRLLFSIVTTVYIFADMALEKHGLLAHHREDFVAYRGRAAMPLPLQWRRAYHSDVG